MFPMGTGPVSHGEGHMQVMLRAVGPAAFLLNEVILELPIKVDG